MTMKRLSHLVPFFLAAATLPAQAVLLGDIRPGFQGSGTFGFAELQGRLFFNGDTATGGDLFATDGTPAGTVPFNLPAQGARYYGAIPLAVGNLLYFIGRTTAHGAELWSSDGTPARTQRLTDLNAGPTDSGINHMTSWRGYCLFTATVPIGTTYGIWRTDGTTAGTVEVAQFSALLRSLVVAGDKLFFVAIDSTHGDELWVLDDPHGTPRLVHDIRPGTLGSAPGYLTEWRNQLYFAANDGTHGSELWTSDGTSAGTRLVADVIPGGNPSQPALLTPTRDWLFFVPRDVNAVPYLMQTDGTATNTGPVPNNPPLIGTGGTNSIVAVGNTAYAVATTQRLSPTVDLWRFDGSPNGTVRVRGSDPNRALLPLNLCAVGSRYVYFQGNDGVTGAELWRSDGTVTGTTPVADVLAGSAGSGPAALQPIGGHLVFLANAGLGLEPYAVPLDAHGQAVGSACGASGRATTMAATDPVLGQLCRLSGGSAFPGSAGFLFLSLPSGPQPLPVGGPSCRWLLSLAQMLSLGAVGVSGGTWSLDLPIPNHTSFQRVLLRAQGLFAPTDGVGGIDATNAVNLHLGT